MVKSTSNKLGMTNNQLKIIAMISMVIDHIGVYFFPSVTWLRIIGRISFPIYAYLIAEGCRHTKNRTKYLGIIGVMGILFQIVFFVFMKSLYQGILVTFSLSIIIIFSIEALIKGKGTKDRILAIFGLGFALFVGFVCPRLFADQGFVIDYNIWGISLPVIMYFTPSKKLRVVFLVLFITLMALMARPIQWWALMSVPFIALYNGERGRAKMKYFFYIFYPLHLVLLFLIKIIITFLK